MVHKSKLEAFADGKKNAFENLKFVLTLFQMTNLNFFELIEITDDNFEFDKNGGKSSERVVNTVGKEGIAHYEQFLLLQRSFQKLVLQTCKRKGSMIWERVNKDRNHFLLFLQSLQKASSERSLTLYHTITTFNDP